MTPTRRHSLALLGAAAIAPAMAPRTAAAPRHHYDLTPLPVAQGVWMIEGSTDYFSDANGGAIVNCVLLDSDAGMIIVDTGPSLRYGEALRLVAEGLTGKGIAAIINTHHHPDHYFGNQAFANLPIYGLPRMASLAVQHGDGFADNMYRILGDWMRGTEPVPPNRLIDGATLNIGGRRLDLLPLSGHTEADLTLIDSRTGTAIAGDLAFLDRAATTPNADLALWRDALDFIAAANPAAIIPGHGPIDPTGASLTQTRGYLDWLEVTLTEAAHSGLDMVEVMGLPIPPEHAALGAMPEEFFRSVSHLFPAIELTALPLSD